MATVNPPAGGPRWLRAIGENRTNVSYALVAVGLALLAVAVFLAFRYRWELGPEVMASGLAGLAALGCGLWYLQAGGEGLGDLDLTHLLVLTLGGLVGLSLVVWSIGRGAAWWGTISGGVEAWQGPEGRRLWLVLGLMLLGLAVLFFSLMLARGEERDHPLLRRLLYGYVAVLTGLLLLLILLVVNVLAYLYMPEPSDWTSGRIYTLSEQSQKILKGLDKPTKVYFLLASRREFDPRFPSYFEDVSTLLDNVRSAAGNRVETEIVLRDANRGQLAKLVEKYQLVDAAGLLVVHGKEGEESHQFLKQEELYDLPPPGRRGGRPPFKGEDALVSAVSYLSEGKAQAVVYFTQGNGELDIGVGGMPASRPDQRALALVGRLTKANYEVKGLALSALAAKDASPRLVTANRVPEDAAAVVIAGPQRPFSDFAVEALRKYMNTPDAKGNRGKLLVLAGVVAGPEGKMVPTGLEGLLGEFNVELGVGRILQASQGNPARVLATTNPLLGGRNPVAAVLDRVAIPLVDARPVRVRRGGERPGNPYQADDLLRVPPQLFIWVDDNLREDPQPMVETLLQTEEGRKKLEARLSPEPLSVGVTSSEAAGPPGMDPTDPHSFMDRGQQKPRLVVIGNAAIASDANIAEGSRRGDIYYTLLGGSLAWLREKPNAIGIPPRVRKDYQMDADTNVSRMILMPAALMGLAVAGLGLGIWLVRRR